MTLLVKLDGNGEAESYPYHFANLRADHPDVSFPEGALPADTLADFGVAIVTAVPAPDPTTAQTLVEGTPEFVGGEWVQTWQLITRDLEDRKGAMRQSIDARRDQAFAAGFLIAGTGTALDGHTLQTRGAEDKINWLTSQASYAAAIAGGFGAVEDATFRTSANDTIVLSYAQGHAVLLAMAAWGKAIMGNSWALKDAVNEAADHDDLDEIDITAGWPAEAE